MFTDTKPKMKFLKDKYMTMLFSDIELRDFVLDIISLATKIDLDDLKNDFEVIDIKLPTPSDVKSLETDFFAKYQEGFINIEFNYLFNGSYTLNKNMSYICAIILKQLETGKNKKYNLKPIYQINLNGFDLFKKGEFIYESTIMEKKYHQTRGNILTIYDINLEYLYQISYNGIRKLGNESLEKKLYFTICDDLKELRDIYEGDETMEKVTEKLDEMESVLDKFFYYDKEEILKHDSYEMGVEHGMEKGIMQNRLDNAKALKVIGVERKKIIEALKLTPEEIALLNL